MNNETHCYHLQPVRIEWGNYSTYLFTDKAIDIINTHDKTKPLFLYLPYQAVHSANFIQPIQAPPELVNKFKNISDVDRRAFAAVVSALDTSIGKVRTRYSLTLIIVWQEPISRSEQLPCSDVTVFSRTDLFLVHSSREFRPNHMHPYLIIDVTRSLNYHQSETKMAGSSEDELSDSSRNSSVVSYEDFEVSSSSEDSVRVDELENELAAIFFFTSSLYHITGERNFT